MAKSLYHSELRTMGPVQVTVKKEWSESTKKKGTYYTTLVVNGAERYYNPENQNCLSFWAGKAGQTITVVADGSREEATLIQMQTGAQVAPPVAAAPAVPPPAAPVRPPTAAQTPAVRPPAATQPGSGLPRPTVASPGKMPRDERGFGQQIGMCINQAVAYACHSGEIWNPQAIMERASDLMRISDALYAGQLSPKFSERIKTQKPADGE